MGQAARGEVKITDEIKAIGQVTPAGEQIVKTTCHLCVNLCGMLVHLSDGKVVRVEGDPESPVGQGSLCPKGWAICEIMNSPKRLRHPLKRAGAKGERSHGTKPWTQ